MTKSRGARLQRDAAPIMSAERAEAIWLASLVGVLVGQMKEMQQTVDELLRIHPPETLIPLLRDLFQSRPPDAVRVLRDLVQVCDATRKAI